MEKNLQHAKKTIIENGIQYIKSKWHAMSILITSLDVSIFPPLWPLFLMCHCLALCVPKVQEGVNNFFWYARTKFFLQIFSSCRMECPEKEMLKSICDFLCFITFDLQFFFSNTSGWVNYTIIQFLTSCYVPHTFKMVVVISELLWYPQSTKAILKRHKTCQIPCKHFFQAVSL